MTPQPVVRLATVAVLPLWLVYPSVAQSSLETDMGLFPEGLKALRARLKSLRGLCNMGIPNVRL